MKITYKILQTNEGFNYVKEQEIGFCCDRMKELYGDDKEIELFWSKHAPISGITGISVNHRCSGEEVWSSGFDISYCPFCGGKIELVRVHT